MITGRVCFYAVVLAAVAGCGGGPKMRPDWAVVSGKVTYKGNPVPGGSVMWCTEQDPPVLRGGAIQEDGTYTLEAPIGAAKIAIHTSDMKTIEPSRFVDIPAKYTDPNKSGLSFEVKAGDNNDVNFDLQ